MKQTAIDSALTVQEVAKELSISIYTVYELLGNGTLKGFKIKTHWRVQRACLDEFKNRPSEGGK